MPPRTPAPDHLAWLLPLAVSAIWGTNLAIVRLAIGSGLHPFAFNGVRLAFSVVVLAAVLRWESRRQSSPPLPLGRVMLVALIGPLLNQCLSVSGLARTPAGNAGLLGTTSPVWTALLAATFGIERVTLRMWGAIALTVLGAGTIVVASHGVDFSARYFTGNLLVLAAAFTWAITTILCKPLVGVLSPTRLACWSNLLVLPVHGVLAVYNAPPSWALSPQVWACIAYAGVLSTGIAAIFWNHTIKTAGAARAAIYTNLVPVFAMTAGALMLGEDVTLTQLSGGVLIVAGVVLAHQRRR